MKGPQELITKYLHGNLTAQEMGSLSEWVKSDSSHAKDFAIATFIHSRTRHVLAGDSGLSVDDEVEIGLLGEEAVAETPPKDSSRVEGNKSGRITFVPKALFLVLAASMAVAITSVFWPQPQGIATLSAEVDSDWGDGVRRVSGQPLVAADYELISGLAMLQYDNGAEVIVEAPAKFQLGSNSHISLPLGKIVATCATEESRGFTVTLPRAKIVDLGTEFGVEVEASGESEVQVFEGVVEVSPIVLNDDSEMAVKSASLAGGEVAELDASGSVVSIANLPNNESYVRRSDFEIRQRVGEKTIPKEWLSHYRELQEDPDLLFWSDMNPNADFLNMVNLSSSKTRFSQLQNGRGRAQFVPGRWAKNLAVQLRDPNEQIAVNIPGKFKNLTFAAWVKFAPNRSGIDESRRHRGMLLSNWEIPGHVHWQRKGDGFRVTVITKNGGASRQFAKFVAMTPSLGPGIWHLLASTIDTTDKHSVSHYLDGKLVGHQRIESPLPALSLGPCGLGGWSKNTSDDRSLNGAIDDFFIWSRALSKEEIENLYQWSSL